jgi:hypothetical protein
VCVCVCVFHPKFSFCGAAAPREICFHPDASAYEKSCWKIVFVRIDPVVLCVSVFFWSASRSFLPPANHVFAGGLLCLQSAHLDPPGK